MKKLCPLVLGALGLAACPVKGSLGEHDLDTDATTDHSMTDESGEESTSTYGGWGEDEGGSGGWGETGPDWEGTGETGDLPTCEVFPEDDPCGVCEKSHCCAEVHHCLLAPHCGCIVDCVLNGHGIESCVEHCEDSPAGEHEDLLECLANECADACH